MTMTSEVRSYLERTIPARRQEQLVNDPRAMDSTVDLVATQCQISIEDARRELNSFLTSTGADIQIRLTDRASDSTDDLEVAVRAHDYREKQAASRQRLLDSIVDYQLSLFEIRGEPAPNRRRMMELHKDAESVLQEILGSEEPDFIRGRDPKRDSDLVALRDKFMIALDNAPDGLTRVGISDATNTNYGKWRSYRNEVLSHLLDNGTIIRVGTEKRGRYYLSDRPPKDFVREDERVREVYEAVYVNGPLSRSRLMTLIGNDSISGRNRVQDILDRLIGDTYLKSSTDVRGFQVYEVA